MIIIDDGLLSDMHSITSANSRALPVPTIHMIVHDILLHVLHTTNFEELATK